MASEQLKLVLPKQKQEEWPEIHQLMSICLETEMKKRPSTAFICEFLEKL